MDMMTNASAMYTTSFVLQDALSGVDSFQHTVAPRLRGYDIDEPHACKGAPAPLCPLSQAQLHTFDVDALVQSNCMHEDVACGAASAAVAAGAVSQCGCEGGPPDAHSSRHAGSCHGPTDAINAYDTFQRFGALVNDSHTQKEACQRHSMACDHACCVTQMQMASGSAAELACAPTEDLANEGAADSTPRSNGGCLSETARTDEGFTEAAQPQTSAGEVDGKCRGARRNACNTPQIPCMRDAATRHCNMSRCEGIAACDLLQVSEEAGFFEDGRHAACAADVMCSQHASPQRSGGEGILGAVFERGAQLGGHSGGSVTAHASHGSGDVEEHVEEHAAQEHFQCMKCAKDKQQTQKLLGESGEMFESAREALAKIQDVHVSDELMHFEFWGPFWELTEVRAAFLPFVLSFFPPIPSPESSHQRAYESCKCPPLQCCPRC
jgi:hypothetical protein